MFPFVIKFFYTRNMIKIIILSYLLFPLNLFSQDDIPYRFEYVNDDNLRISNELNDIQILNFIFYDTTYYDKIIKITYKEFEKGKVVSEEDFGFDCKNVSYPVVVKGDTINYSYNFCDDIRFERKMEEKKSIFAVKIGETKTTLICDFGSLKIKNVFEAKLDYKFNEIRLKTVFDINKKIPIFAFTPPIKNNNNGAGSYCALNYGE